MGRSGNILDTLISAAHNAMASAAHGSNPTGLPASDSLARSAYLRNSPAEEAARGSSGGFFADSMQLSRTISDPGAFPQPVDPATEVFGGESYRVLQQISLDSETPSLALDPLFQIAVLALTGLFFYIMLHYRSEASQLLRLVSGRKREGRSPDNYQSVLSGFVNAVFPVFLLICGIAVTRGVDIFTAGGSAVVLPAPITEIPALLILAVMLTVGLIGILQVFVLKIAGRIVFEDDFVKRLLWQRNITMVALTVAAGPLTILMGLSPEPWCDWAAWGLLIIAGLALLRSAWTSLSLFVSQKVSILFWILYLCAVEWMPYCIVVLATLRGVAC